MPLQIDVTKLPTIPDLGEAGYRAYSAHCGGKTFDGRPMPTWEQLGQTPSGIAVQSHWRAAAAGILDAQDKWVGVINEAMEGARE